MNTQDEQEQAAATLAAIRGHQERARRAARLPWWVYAVMFALIAGGCSLYDFVGRTGARVIAIVILVLFVVVLRVTFANRTAPLSWVRGVQPRQSYNPRVVLAVTVAGCLGAWLIDRFGGAFAHSVGTAIGLRGYPDTATGILAAAVFTAVFALGHLLTSMSQRRTTQ